MRGFGQPTAPLAYSDQYVIVVPPGEAFKLYAQVTERTEKVIHVRRSDGIEQKFRIEDGLCLDEDPTLRQDRASSLSLTEAAARARFENQPAIIKRMHWVAGWGRTFVSTHEPWTVPRNIAGIRYSQTDDEDMQVHVRDLHFDIHEVTGALKVETSVPGGVSARASVKVSLQAMEKVAAVAQQLVDSFRKEFPHDFADVGQANFTGLFVTGNPRIAR